MAANDLQIQAPFNFPWAEYVSKDTGYTQAYRWGVDSTQATFTIDVPWENYIDTSPRGVIPNILGYSQRQQPTIPGGPGTISRLTPMRHPYYPWLFANAITDVKGIKPTGKFIQRAGFNSAAAQYHLARLTIGFNSPTYPILTDDQLANIFGGDESYRYVTKNTEATAEYISIDRGTYKFFTGTNTPPDGATFNLGTGRITIKVDLEWTWHDVPAQSLFANLGTGNIPTNLYNCLGKVNSGAIWGFPAGTLLMMPPKITPTVQPISPLTMGLQQYDIPRSYDVKLYFKYWDPPTSGNSGFRGHNLAMYPRDGLFYLIVSILTNGGFGGTLYNSADFTQIFQGL